MNFNKTILLASTLFAVLALISACDKNTPKNPESPDKQTPPAKSKKAAKPAAPAKSKKAAKTPAAPAKKPAPKPKTQFDLKNKRIVKYEGEWNRIKKCMPLNYVIQKTNKPVKIDGTGSDPAWKKAAWTEYFVDIEGAANPARKPKFKTRAKMLWDDKYIYFYAEMEEPHIWATLEKKNDIIYWDNDFEIFIDPNGDCQNYYEFEMNAFNTIWELYLTRAYRVGGEPRWNKKLKNGKVEMKWGKINIDGVKTAVSIRGTINDATDKDSGWSVEVAIPFAGLAKYGANNPPKVGDHWRLNFSRVNWDRPIKDGKYGPRPHKFGLEYNWVWSPIGVISMHTPENWGYVQFADKPGTKFRPDRAFTAKRRLMEVFYRQREYFKKFGVYANNIEKLGMKRDSYHPIRIGTNMMMQKGTDKLKPTYRAEYLITKNHTVTISQNCRIVESISPR